MALLFSGKSQSDLHRLQTVFTQTRQELEKTRHLLELQCKINSDLEAEKKLMTKKLTDCQAESEERSREQAELLSKRMTKIHHLQKQLHDLAYGTKQLKLIPTTVDDVSDRGFCTVRTAIYTCKLVQGMHENPPWGKDPPRVLRVKFCKGCLDAGVHAHSSILSDLHKCMRAGDYLVVSRPKHLERVLF